jgi:hypothetical protein
MDQFLEHYAATERSLRESEERFRLMVEGLRDYAIFRSTKPGMLAAGTSAHS